ARARKVAEIESHSDVFDRSGMLERPVTSSRNAPAVPQFIEATELSSTHLTTEIMPPFPEEKPRSRKRALVLAALGTAIAIGGVGFYLSTRKPTAPVPAPQVITETASPAIMPIASTSTSTSASPRPSPSTSTSPSSTTTPSAPTPRAAVKRPPPVKAGCNPPYTVDAQGIKKYKVE